MLWFNIGWFCKIVFETFPLGITSDKKGPVRKQVDFFNENKTLCIVVQKCFLKQITI